MPENITRAFVMDKLAHEPRPDFRGLDLSGLDLSGLHFRGADLTNADLRGTSLSRSDLSGAVMRRADIRGADLRGANLAGAVLSGIRSDTAFPELEANPDRQHLLLSPETKARLSASLAALPGLAEKARKMSASLARDAQIRPEELTLIEQCGKAYGDAKLAVIGRMVNPGDPGFRSDVDALRLETTDRAAVLRDTAARDIRAVFEKADFADRSEWQRGCLMPSAEDLGQVLANARRIERESDVLFGKDLPEAALARPQGRVTPERMFSRARRSLNAAFVRAAGRELKETGRVAGVSSILRESGTGLDVCAVTVPDKSRPGQTQTFRFPEFDLEDRGIPASRVRTLERDFTNARIKDILQPVFADIRPLPDASRAVHFVPLLRRMAKADAEIRQLLGRNTRPLLDPESGYPRYKEARAEFVSSFLSHMERDLEGKRWQDLEISCGPAVREGVDVRAGFRMREDMPEDKSGRPARTDDAVYLFARKDGIPCVRDVTRNGSTVDIGLADKDRPFRTAQILRVPGADLEAKGFSAARQMGLALRYSGPYVDATAARDAEYLVSHGQADNLADAMAQMMQPNASGQRRLPDMRRTLSLSHLADLASSREVFSEAREEASGPKLPDSAPSVLDDWTR